MAFSDAAFDRQIAPLLGPARNADGHQQGESVEQRFHIERAAELLNTRYTNRENGHADQRAPDVDPSWSDGGGSEKSADERGQQKLEADAGLPDLQPGGQQNAGESRQSARCDKSAHDVLADGDAIELGSLGVGADHIQSATQWGELRDDPKGDADDQDVERTHGQAHQIGAGNVDESFGQFTHDLAPTAVPQSNGVDHCACAQGGDEGVDLRQLHQQSIEDAECGRTQHDDDDRHRPGQTHLCLKADGKDVPEHNAVAHREVDLSRDHGNGGSQRQHGNHRLVGQDGTQIEQRREGLWQKDRKQQGESHRQQNQAVDRHGSGQALNPGDGLAIQ